MKQVHWLQEKPHVSYLICLIAGNLEKLEAKHRDVPLGFYTQPSKAKHAEFAFRDTPAIMAFFEEEIGVPYPWDKYDQATCADYHWGGMENTTITTLTQRTIYSDATENIRSSRSLDAHEMAHQWFGDYVTCKDWSHLWLNEGFATYYALLYEGHKYGRDAMLYGLYLDARDDIGPYEKDLRPIVYRDYKVPREQFDFRAYPKGSWVLHMLRSQLGDGHLSRGDQDVPGAACAGRSRHRRPARGVRRAQRQAARSVLRPVGVPRRHAGAEGELQVARQRRSWRTSRSSRRRRRATRCCCSSSPRSCGSSSTARSMTRRSRSTARSTISTSRCRRSRRSCGSIRSTRCWRRSISTSRTSCWKLSWPTPKT